MKQNNFTFQIGDLVRGPQGTKFTFEIDEENSLIDPEKDFTPKGNIKGKISFMKLDDGILAEIRDLGLDVKFNCNKCRTDFIKKIKIQNADRVYFFEKQRGIQDLMDIFYVDLKNMEIDTSDFIRQEIILHFPMIPVCSNSCKGLCPKCGTNLNKKSCNCKTDSDLKDQEKPLAILKQLYNAKTSSSEEKDS